ncbi:NADH-quinone oxidoreductase subunit NuoN [Campylobacter sp. faydin G-140]|uniref:NADH-quinone oxidoreductase subunit NuoN n=1 Tax=Campylobacter anatolicus TaxID=2829105 RepID=UPI001BA03E2F|nr:NADH-quinone oxidoreductase subunit NuoN [Campylobacter anatolicus]MBR8465466.1 NADH-quinone oxidoreductase subunit NuoN [Campylobacter anatolicus]
MNELTILNLKQLSFASISPMLSLIVFALFILCVGVAKKDLSRRFYSVFCIIAISINVGLVLDFNGLSSSFFDMLLIDGIAIISQLIILLASSLFIPLALSSKEYFEYKIAEYYALFLFMLAGFEFMVSSNNLLVIFIGLETSSLALYTIIALHNKVKSVEAALKYFTMGSLSAGFFSFGMAMFYLVCGSIDIAYIGATIANLNLSDNIIVLFGCVFIASAIGFKLSLIPFHTWVPDVYEGSNAPLAGYMSIVPKVAGFIVAMRFFEMLSSSGLAWVQDILYIVAVATMSIANIMALVQRDVKRMLAFSSIAHAGVVLCALVVGDSNANIALFFYWIMFVFANLGAFSMLWVARCDDIVCFDKRFKHPYEKFAGIVKFLPSYAVIMAIFMIALAGIPPFSVFWGKMLLLNSLISSGFIILAIIVMINSAIAIYYYTKLIVFMFLKEPIVTDKSLYTANVSMALKVIVGFAVVGTMFAFLFGGVLIEYIGYFVHASGF